MLGWHLSAGKLVITLVINARVSPRQVEGCTVEKVVDHSPHAAILKTHDAVRLCLYDLVYTFFWLHQHLQHVVTVALSY